VLTGNEEISPLQHWAGRNIAVQADPPQPVVCDGELLGDTPLDVEVLPGTLSVLVPGGNASDH
jgi:diacylglycerol kinase family enzyme